MQSNRLVISLIGSTVVLAMLLCQDPIVISQEVGAMVRSANQKQELSGLSIIKVNGKFGYIDRTGKLVIQPQFDFAYNFSSSTGLAKVEIDKKVGYVDRTGKYI